MRRPSCVQSVAVLGCLNELDAARGDGLATRCTFFDTVVNQEQEARLCREIVGIQQDCAPFELVPMLFQYQISHGLHQRMRGMKKRSHWLVGKAHELLLKTH